MAISTWDAGSYRNYIHSDKKRPDSEGTYNIVYYVKDSEGNKTFRYKKNPSFQYTRYRARVYIRPVHEDIVSQAFYELDWLKRFALLRREDVAKDWFLLWFVLNLEYKRPEYWKLANDHKLSPKLHYYGYTQKKRTCQDRDIYLFNPKTRGYSKVRASSIYDLHETIVSEKYDMNLHHLYHAKRTNRGSLNDEDLQIQRQLTTLLNKTSALGIDCLDIKPGNCVVKRSKSGKLVVRLIDWDDDWCKEIRSSNHELCAVMSNLLMANHFFYYLNHNIFSKYFLKNKRQFDRNMLELYKIFCKHDRAQEWLQATCHYFGDSLDKPTSSEDCEKRYGGTNCISLFVQLYNNCFYLNVSDRGNKKLVLTHRLSKQNKVFKTQRKRPRRDKTVKKGIKGGD